MRKQIRQDVRGAGQGRPHGPEQRRGCHDEGMSAVNTTSGRAFVMFAFCWASKSKKASQPSHIERPWIGTTTIYLPNCVILL